MTCRTKVVDFVLRWSEKAETRVERFIHWRDVIGQQVLMTSGSAMLRQQAQPMGSPCYGS